MPHLLVHINSRLMRDGRISQVKHFSISNKKEIVSLLSRNWHRFAPRSCLCLFEFISPHAPHRHTISVSGIQLGSYCLFHAQRLDQTIRWKIEFSWLHQVLARCNCSQLEYKTKTIATKTKIVFFPPGEKTIIVHRVFIFSDSYILILCEDG